MDGKARKPNLIRANKYFVLADVHSENREVIFVSHYVGKFFLRISTKETVSTIVS